MTTNKVFYFRKAITTLLVVMAFFILSCEKRIIVREPVEEIVVKEPPEKKVVVDHFARAENYWREMEYDKALEAYERYLTAFPSGDKVTEALARKAAIYYNMDQYDKALPLFLEVIKEYPLNEKRAETHLLIARIYFYLKQYSESRQSALRWIELYKGYPGKEEVFLLLGQTLKELNDQPRAFYWWLRALESPLIEEEKREEIRVQLLDFIYHATEEELKAMASWAQESDFIFPIYYRLAVMFFRSDRLDEAREVALKMVGYAPEERWTIKIQEVLNLIEERVGVNTNVVGCLLPLSGPFALYGQEVLQGVELGFDIFRETNEILSRMELVVRDTQGDSARTVELIEELAENQKALVTIGPLVSKLAEGAAEKAQELGMPIITLSQSQGITSKGEMVFQNCLNPEDQLRSLVNKVIGEMGLQRFAILYPANSYGRYYMNKLWDKVESQGGVITAVESYDPKNTDFAPEIKKMVGLFYPRPSPDMEGEERKLAVEKEGSEEEQDPIIDFDAVFIPDSHERVALLASQLAYYDVVGVTLLGTNLWNSQKLIETAESYVHGAIFPSGFFSGSGYRGVDSFVDRYKSHFGREPGLLAAIGYDTIRIVKEILREKGKDIRTRRDLRLSLAEERSFETVTGPMLFDEERRAKRDPLLLTISGKHFLPMP